MPRTSYKEFTKNVSLKKFDKVYFFYGDEKYLIKRSETLITNNIKNKSQFNFLQVDGEQLDLDKLDVYLNTYPLGSDKKCALIKNIEIGSFDKDFILDIENLIKNIPDFAILIISQFNNYTEPNKLAKLRNFISNISLYSCVVEISSKDNVNLEEQIISLARDRGKNMPYNIARNIINRCGKNVSSLYNEVEKLCSFEISDTISKASVSAITTEQVDYNVFSMCNSLLSGKYYDMYKRLDNLFCNNESPILILSAIASNYIDMFRVKVSLNERRDPYELANFFDYKNKKFKIDIASRNVDKMGMEQIKYSIRELIRADIELKNSSISPKIILNILLGNLIRIKERK